MSESASERIEATSAFVMLTVTSEKLVFGNAALSGSQQLKTVVEKIKSISGSH